MWRYKHYSTWLSVLYNHDQNNLRLFHCVKSVCIRRYSGPYFPAFELNMERYSVSFRFQPECGKIRTRITPNTDAFYSVFVILENFPLMKITMELDGAFLVREFKGFRETFEMHRIRADFSVIHTKWKLWQ